MRRSPARSRSMRRNPIRAAKRTPCVRRSYWGRGGAGMMFVCSEDRTVLLLLRAEWVEQGGTWGVPGGGIGEGFFSTPMEPIDDPEVFLRKAAQEVEEECGSLPPGFSEAQILGTTQYEDCGFRYRTFIVDVTAKQKAAWRLVSEDDETDAFVWFPWGDVLSGQPLDDADQHFGVVFTMKNLPATVASRFGRSNPRRRNPRDLQTETPEFKAWFGNSKMLDEHGEPERLYHITASEFSVFKPGGNDPRLSGRVIYLTPYPHNIPAGHNVMDYVKGEGLVYRQGASVVPVYASIQRPLYIFDADDAQYAERFKFDSFAFPRTVSDKSLAALKEAGYDGIVYAGWRDAEGFDLRTGRNVEIIAFEPTQIKSAIGNRGTFDPEEADIRHNPRRRTRPVSRRIRRNPEDRAHIRDLLDRLEEFKSSVMEAAGDDPYETSFDPMDYPIYDDTLASYLDATVLGWGASRVVVLLPSGNVAKLPWTDEIASNEQEWENWQEASEEVQAMLLPPLEYISGVLVFPLVKTVHDRDYDDPELSAARARWKALWLAGAPGADVEDFQNTQNWGIYTDPETGAQRVVLIDYAE